MIDVMIEHVDAALTSWLATVDGRPDVVVERRLPATDDDTDARVVLVLTRVAEQLDRRDNRVDDVRDTDGTVTARQRPMRYFELDYSCGVSGPPEASHRTLGALLQRLVDGDVVPVEHVPAPLAELGVPIGVELVTPSSTSAALAFRVVLPVRPAPDHDVSAPATTLHLDVSRPDEPTPRDPGGTGERVAVPIDERRWTTVRRRELIGRAAEET